MPRTYKIGEVARHLKLATSVLRYWETEFPQLAPIRTPTGQRIYTDATVRLLEKLKDLLHTKGMTIEGARRLMRKPKADAAFLDGETATSADIPQNAATPPAPAFQAVRPDLSADLQALRDDVASIRTLLGGGA